MSSFLSISTKVDSLLGAASGNLLRNPRPSPHICLHLAGHLTVSVTDE